MSAPFGRRRQHVTARIAANAFILLAIFQILIPSSSASASISSFLPTQTDATATSTSTIEFSAGVLLESSVLNQLAQFTSIPPVPLPTNISGYDTFSQMANLMPPFQASAGTVVPDIAAMLASIKMSAAASINKGLPVESLTGRQAAIRVMIVGDSMTQGHQGDWTWRYRIWEWFKEQRIDVDFVGPYAGTVEPDLPSAPAPPPLYGVAPPTSSIKSSGGYAVGASVDFDSDHFAVWGRAAAVDKGLIQDVVAAHQADLMLLMLGFNDMGWFYSDAQGTLDSIHTLITNARAANPNLKFAVANVPQRSFIGGREDLPLNTNIYNSLLSNSIPRWSTTQSPISLVELQENYSCDRTACPVGYDGLHPNALGEYQIARAFTATLVNNFQLGTSPLTIPSDIPARPLQAPSWRRLEGPTSTPKSARQRVSKQAGA
ncbi:hypothetical protein ACLOAV_010439 [Pseudogymnoascus australis]